MGKLFDFLSQRGVGWLAKSRGPIACAAGNGDQNVLLCPFRSRRRLHVSWAKLTLNCVAPNVSAARSSIIAASARLPSRINSSRVQSNLSSMGVELETRKDASESTR